MEEATGVAPDREQAEEFVSGQVGVIQWPADPPDPGPARRVTVGDRVWIYDPRPREIVARVVVGGEPDFGRGEVSRDSPYGASPPGSGAPARSHRPHRPPDQRL